MATFNCLSSRQTAPLHKRCTHKATSRGCPAIGQGFYCLLNPRALRQPFTAGLVQHRLACKAAEQQPASKPAAEQEESEGLLPEEDYEVPGSYFDALNPNTKLGKAVKAATEELEILNQLEAESLKQADELLKKLGLKKSIFDMVQSTADVDADAAAADAEASSETKQ